jgi:hypothetical protein
MAIFYRSSTASIEVARFFATVLYALQSNRHKDNYDTEQRVTQNQEHSSYVHQQLSRCVLGRTKDALVSGGCTFRRQFKSE